jgi:hypothetical protein
MGEDEIMKKKTRSPQKEPSPEPQVPDPVLHPQVGGTPHDLIFEPKPQVSDPVLHPQVGGTPGQKEHRRIFKDLSEDK